MLPNASEMNHPPKSALPPWLPVALLLCALYFVVDFVYWPIQTTKPLSSAWTTEHDVSLYVGAAHRIGNRTVLVVAMQCIGSLEARARPSGGDREGEWWQLHQNVLSCPEWHCDHNGYTLSRVEREYSGERLLPGLSPTSAAGPGLWLTGCTPPLVFFADWISLIDFMELWTAQGLQLLHTYWQAITPEVQTVAQLYAAEGLTQLHEWSALPDQLNRRLFTFGQVVSYKDCLLRNQDAHFTAFFDLDEYLYVAGGSARQYLQSLPSDVGAVFLYSSRAYAEAPIQGHEFKPREHSLAYLSRLWVNYTDRMPKSIVRAHAVQRLEIHTIEQMTAGYRLAFSYFVLVLESFDASAKHSARVHIADQQVAFAAHVRKTETLPSNLTLFTGLRDVLGTAESAWQRRRTQLPDSRWSWPVAALSPIFAFAACHRTLHGPGGEVGRCNNPYVCDELIPRNVSFVRPTRHGWQRLQADIQMHEPRKAGYML